MRLSRRAIFVGLFLLIVGAAAVYTTSKLLSGETVLYIEPDDPGPDPFTDPAVFASDVEQPTVPPTTTLPAVAASPGASPDPAATSTTAFVPIEPPAEPVLLARQGDCDPIKLIQLLAEDDEKKQAFADVLEIDFEEVDDYILALRPTVLSRDTRVTYHGFKDGEANEFQAILAEGTSVLVDSNGDIVVRCNCGNPLSEPLQIKYKCDGCPENYEPPAPCEGTCYPEPTTTTTTLPPITTTVAPTTIAGGSTTTTRRTSTTRGTGTTVAGATTTRAGGTAATTTRPGTAVTTTVPTTTAPPTTTMPPATSTICILPGLCLN